jgi:SAM-dependent methyltransferase
MDLREISELSLAAQLWQTTRFDIYRDALAQEGAFERPIRVLDVGSGDAWFAEQLAREEPRIAEITCWDVGYDDPGAVARASQAAKLRHRADRPTEAFDLVLALDVIEHVEDDVGFLRPIVRDNLAPGGLACISVPAYSALFGEHDRRLKHYRRYDAASARSALERSGLTIVKAGGAFFLPLAVRAAQVVVERTLGIKPAPSDSGSGRAAPRPIVTLAKAGFRAERMLAGWMASSPLDIPGLSWWALCRKSS